MRLRDLNPLFIIAASVLASRPLLAGEAGRVLFDFRQERDLAGWRVEDDGVMGGVSRGRIARNAEGHLVFSGDVSLENNGGFSSVQRFFEPIDVSRYRTVVIRLKGDGKKYRFLAESEADARHYYSAEFPTTGEWQDVEIPLASLEPYRRGDRLDLPNFPGKTLAQVRFLIGNGRAEAFRFEVAEMRLR